MKFIKMKNSEFEILTTIVDVPTFLEHICKNVNLYKHKNFFLKLRKIFNKLNIKS